MAQQVNDEKNDDSEFETVYDPTTNTTCDLFVSNSHFTINNNVISRTSSGSWQNIYGTQVFDPSKQKLKIRWHIKFVQTGSAMIGIATPGDPCTSTYCFSKKTFKNYGYYLNNGHKYYAGTNASFREKFTVGNIMIVELDLIGKKISYWKNNEFLGVAYTNIETNNVKYALAIAATSGKYSIEKCEIYGDIPNINPQVSQISLLLDQCINVMTKLDSKLTNKNDPKFGKIKDIILIQQNLESGAEERNNICEKCVTLCKLSDKVNSEIKSKMDPSTHKYEEWDINNILLWIISLEKGRFKQYYNKLNKSFIEHSMKGSDLPDLTRRDLRDFGVKAFGDSVALEKYCQKLADDSEGDQVTKGN